MEDSYIKQTKACEFMQDASSDLFKHNIDFN